jgi:glycosyltransferase involved in cell wall biosynthesis
VINFISHLPRDLRTGGFSAMNAAACAALERRHQLAYVGPVDPPIVSWEKALSKALRLSGLGGDFFAYSQRRLSLIAGEVERLAPPGASLDFFHGFTWWSMTRPARPYVAWSDCTFHDYIETYHQRRHFRDEDLARIERTEGQWLRAAGRVLFTSDWAARRAIGQYDLDPARVASVGIFGELEAPERDVFAGGARFAFVSTNFAAKGGQTVLEAFRLLRDSHPQARLVIVGAPPPSGLDEPGVEYAGFLRKEVPQEYAAFREILATAVAVAHPTRSDIAPLLLVEAALFGCPAIASRSFAIPELVAHEESGLLLDALADPRAVADAMAWMLEHPEAYARMRREAWRRARALHTKALFEQRLTGHVDAALAEVKAAAA